MVKLMFMVHRKEGLTRDECLAEWTGEQHLAVLDPMKKLGFKKYIQNRVSSPEPEGAPDGIGELWFDDAAAMERVMTSPEMAIAFEDAQRFADIEKSHGIVVEESPIFGS
jgi:uncharacterized protein (TIGR02118 family)